VPPEFAGARLSVEKGINRPSKKGEKKDKKNPRQFVGGFFLFVQNVHADSHAKGPQKKIDIAENTIRTGYDKKDKRQLNKN